MEQLLQALSVNVRVISIDSFHFRLGHAYNESYVEFGRKRHINFCNKLFTAWDFNITDPNTARLKKVQICTDLEVQLYLHCCLDGVWCSLLVH